MENETLKKFSPEFERRLKYAEGVLEGKLAPIQKLFDEQDGMRKDPAFESKPYEEKVPVYLKVADLADEIIKLNREHGLNILKIANECNDLEAVKAIHSLVTIYAREENAKIDELADKLSKS